MNGKYQALTVGMAAQIGSDYRVKRMDMVAYYCPNPDCPCRDVTLRFFDADDKFKTKLFQIVLNYETWQLISSDVYGTDADYNVIIDEFMNDNIADIKSMICSGKEAACSNRHSLRDDIDYASLKINDMVLYSDVYSISAYDQLLLEVDQQLYMASDYYCLNPECDCKEVIIVFDKVNDNKITDPPVMTCRVKFKTGRLVIEDKGISLKLSRQLYKELLAGFDGAGIKLFEERYARIKKWGEVFMQNKAAYNRSNIQITNKVGRNTPCPCGSGKKYKFCCGV